MHCHILGHEDHGMMELIEESLHALSGTQGIELGNYYGAMPSQTNYIASIAGELCNTTSDDPPNRH